jgi:endonuclease G, mitochondrial
VDIRLLGNRKRPSHWRNNKEIMKVTRKSIIYAVLIALSSPIFALTRSYPSDEIANQALQSHGYGFNACRQHFAGGVVPALLVKNLTEKTRELCSSGHATLHSGVTRTPLYSAAHLTKERLSDARELVRTDSFRLDTRLPVEERSTLMDFSRSGYDRGHLVANSDSGNVEEQADTFLLSNIVPQSPTHNRHLWSSIEISSRAMAMRAGEAYMITGVAFLSRNANGKTIGLMQIGSGVVVPTHLFKALYFPRQNTASAWLSLNPVCRISEEKDGNNHSKPCEWDSDGKQYEVISINDLKARVGIDPFPDLSADAKSRVLDFYKPKTR